MNFDDFIKKLDNPDGVQMVNIADLQQLIRAIDEFKRLMNTKNSGEVASIRALNTIVEKLKSVSEIKQVESKEPVVKVDMGKVAQSIERALAKIPKNKDYTEQFEKLAKALERVGEDKEDDELNLMCYRVSDAAEPVTGYQYFGFLKPDGGWYILYNDIVEGKVRYKFGRENYKSAWENYANHEYNLIDEAINEIKD